MAETAPTVPPTDDPTAASRKQDHIEMAFQSRVESGELDRRFYYEPMLDPHPEPGAAWPPLPFLGKTLRAPLWVSSMTGGTALANVINHNLARACAEFGLGMGLGSCRQLLYSDQYLPDFDVRDTIGPELPLYANLGVAQVDLLLQTGALDRLHQLLTKLRADGLIVHVNPLQEAMQPEGDHFARPPLETVQELLEKTDFKIIVKEVGQGFGPASLRALLQLPLAAIEFAAAGGTNFARLELLRSDPMRRQIFDRLAAVGHTAAEMCAFARQLKTELGDQCRVDNLILSGGVRDFLDGYYLLEKSPLPAVYGQASGFLKHARGDYAELRAFVEAQLQGLALAKAFLKVKET
ncbi:MAG: type 2 isopentenyl-diphosphate Delta-isomerase [Saprospiraceae bacterium]|nr:type 2 isopentenyl-diphosphate Delta-isomerase [Saprospiraceae bacterium]